MNPSQISGKTSLQTGRIGEGAPLRNLPGGGTTPSCEAGVEMDPTSEACRLHGNSRNGSHTYNDRLTEVEKLKENAGHLNEDARTDGNWTVENAKSKLHQFLQQHNIKGDYHYSVIEREGCRNFVAELTIYVEKLNCTLTGRDSGPSKLIASKNCALSLVRQLYHHGVIDAFTGSLKLNKEKQTELAPYHVRISPELEDQILDVLHDLNIKPVRVNPTEESQEPISILNTTANDDFVSSRPQPPGKIAWTFPTTNWNPWLSCHINEGPLATMSMDDISKIIEIEFRERLQRGEVLQKVIKERGHLPIDICKKRMMDMINKNPVCIIRGNAGCGKTTQVGQFILNDYIQAGYGAYCNIIVTQPKRISAISIADRVAYERGETVGMSVGYSVRFDTVYPRPYGSILFCTVGTLLKKLELGLKGISHVIVDEIHERDMNTDFILAILRDMVNTYPHLRLILMSATIDTTLFSNYFSGCPVFEIPGQLFPVQEYFLEDTIELVKFYPTVDPKRRKRRRNSGQSHCDEEDFMADDGEENLNLKINPNYSPNTRYAMSLLNEKEINFDLIRDILRYIRNLSMKGAVLIFLPGWSVIFSLMRYLRQCPDFAGQDYVILPLHSCLSSDDQKHVFEKFSSNVTKVILSTNMAESSITINDIVYVIDSCKTKIKTFTSHSNLTYFATVWASRTNLEQRRGRAGRLRPGYCFHLCSRARYEALDQYTTPEMFRSPLYELALAVKMLGLGAIGQFLSKTLEPPPVNAVKEAVALLREMKYLDHNDELTPLGRIIGRLPIEPRLGRMLILGILFNCANALTTIAANSTTLSGVFVNTAEIRELSLEQKAFSGIRYSDHIATINAFQTWERAKEIGTDAELCGSKMLSETSLKLTADAKYQLLSLLENCCGFPRETLMDQVFNYSGPDPNLDMITALLSVGLYPNIAYHTLKRRLLTTGNKIALINKRSVNCSNQDQTFPYPFFVYGEKVKTKAVACKQVTMVTPLSLLLFGARKVEYVKGLIKLDGWINLKMNPYVASCIVALRPALENLIIRAASEPSRIMDLSHTEEKVLRAIRELCKFSAGRYGTAEVHSHAFQSCTHSQDICIPSDYKIIHSQYQPPGVRGRDGQRNEGAYQRVGFGGSVGGSLEPRRENYRGYSSNNQGELVDPRNSRDRRDDQGTWHSRDPRISRNRRDDQGTWHSRDPRISRNRRDDQGTWHSRDPRISRYLRDDQDTRDPREPINSSDRIDDQDMSNTRDPRNSSDRRDVQYLGDPGEPRNTSDRRDVQDTWDPREPINSSDRIDDQDMSNTRDPRNSSDRRDVQYPGDPKEPRNTSDRRDVQYPGDPREPRNTSDRRDVQYPGDPREPRNTSDRRDVQYPGDPREPRNTSDRRDDQDTWDPREPINSSDRIDDQDMSNTRDPRNSSDRRDVQYPGDPKEPRNTSDRRDVQYPGDPREPRNTSDRRDVQCPRDRREPRNSSDRRDVQCPRDRREPRNSSDRRDVQYPGDRREPRNSSDRRDVQYPGDRREPRNSSDRRDVQCPRDRREPRNSSDRRDVQYPGDPGESRNTSDRRDVQYPRDRREPRNSSDRRDDQDTWDPRERRNVRQLKRPRQAVDSRDPRDEREARNPKIPRNTRYPTYSRTHARDARSPRNSTNLRYFRQTRDSMCDRENLRGRWN